MAVGRRANPAQYSWTCKCFGMSTPHIDSQEFQIHTNGSARRLLSTGSPTSVSSSHARSCSPTSPIRHTRPTPSSTLLSFLRSTSFIPRQDHAAWRKSICSSRVPPHREIPGSLSSTSPSRSPDGTMLEEKRPRHTLALASRQSHIRRLHDPRRPRDRSTVATAIRVLKSKSPYI